MITMKLIRLAVIPVMGLTVGPPLTLDGGERRDGQGADADDRLLLPVKFRFLLPSSSQNRTSEIQKARP